MPLHLTKRAAIYCAAVIAMIYVYDLVQGRDPWSQSPEGVSALMGIVLAAVMLPVFFVVDLVRYFKSR
jgi:hypothetical protein